MSNLPHWQRHGTEWILFVGRRKFGRVVPDNKYPGMYRSTMPDGSLSDMANLSWSKDAVLASAERDLEWEARQQAAE